MKKIILVLCILITSVSIYADNKFKNTYIETAKNQNQVLETITPDHAYINWTELTYIIDTNTYSQKIDLNSDLEKSKLKEKCTSDANKSLLELINKTHINSNNNFNFESLLTSHQFLYNDFSDTNNSMYYINCYGRCYIGSIKGLLDAKNKLLEEEYNILINTKATNSKDNYINIDSNDEFFKNIKNIENDTKLLYFADKDDFFFEKKFKEDRKYVKYKIKDPTKKITGLVIDTNGLGIEYSLCQKIRLSDGKVIFSPAMLKDNDVIQKNISNVKYVTKIKRNENPLIITAINVSRSSEEGAYTDIVLDNYDAYLVQLYLKYSTQMDIIAYNPYKYYNALLTDNIHFSHVIFWPWSKDKKRSEPYDVKCY